MTKGSVGERRKMAEQKKEQQQQQKKRRTTKGATKEITGATKD
jgi:hypothetical protein